MKSKIDKKTLTLQVFDYRADFETLGSVTSQLFLAKMASQRLLELGAAESDYILRIRPDTFSNSEVFYSTLYNRMTQIISDSKPTNSLLWTSFADVLEPFMASDILYCAKVSCISKLKVYPTDSIGTSILHNRKPLGIRAEAYLHSQLFDYTMANSFISLMATDFIAHAHNKDYFKIFLPHLILKSEPFRIALSNWHSCLQNTIVGYPIAQDELFLLRNDGNHRPIIFGHGNVDRHFRAIEEAGGIIAHLPLNDHNFTAVDSNKVLFVSKIFPLWIKYIQNKFP